MPNCPSPADAGLRRGASIFVELARTGSGGSSPPEAFSSKVVGGLETHPVFGVGPANPLEIKGKLRSESGLSVEEGG